MAIGSHEPKPLQELIPFWGDNGLINQVCTQIKRKPDFRVHISRYLDAAQEIWPECPAEIEGDSLVIKATSPKQLDIQLDPVIEAGRGIRKTQKELQGRIVEGQSQVCPDCTGAMVMRKGKLGNPDFWYCKKCRKAFFKKDHPELY